MKNISITLVCFICAAFSLHAQCDVNPSLGTPYNDNNGQRGVMFDINTTNEVRITCFDANIYAGTTANYEIYYKVGSFQGSEMNVGDWTLVGTATGLTSAGNDVPTPIPIPVNVCIPAGQTYGFYITNDFGGGVNYTDCNSATDLLASNSDFTITGGVGKSYPFGLTFSFRCANIHAHFDYDNGNCGPPSACSDPPNFIR